MLPMLPTHLNALIIKGKHSQHACCPYVAHVAHWLTTGTMIKKNTYGLLPRLSHGLRPPMHAEGLLMTSRFYNLKF